MSLHITFADGSNPYIHLNMSVKEFARELMKWAKNFDLEYDGETGTILYFIAKEKRHA